jgi:PAS domain-containing protein
MENAKAVPETASASWQERLAGMRRSPLARRLLAAILIVSTVGALVATIIQLAFDYHHDVEEVRRDLESMQKTVASTLAYNLWIVNPGAVHRQINDLLTVPGVRFVEVVENDGTRYDAGQAVAPSRDLVERTFKLEYRHPVTGQMMLMGTARIEASTVDIKSRLFERFLLILGTQGLKAFLVSVFILVFFQWLVTRHLRRLTSQARHVNYLSLRNPLTLDRMPEDDELNELVDAFNQMRRNLLRDIELWEREDRALAQELAIDRATLAALPEATIRTDADGIVNWMNPAAEALCGYRLRLGAGNRLLELLPPAPGFIVWSAERLFLDAQKADATIRRRVVFALGDGRIMSCDGAAALLHDDEGLAQGGVIVLTAAEPL